MNELKKKITPFKKGGLVFFFFILILYLFVRSLAYRNAPIIGNSGNGKIAIVTIEGMIAASDSTIKLLNQYREDTSIRGILLRIDTPGGGVGASQEIHEAVIAAKKKKKIVASMGGIATSGGYYIAVAADKIVAPPGTITGSIGVIMTLSSAEELLKKIGLKTTIVKSGKYKDMGLPNRDLTEEELGILQGVSDDIHNQFIEAVALGRKMKVEDVRKIADGRIFSGRQAKEIGLIDEIGNREKAISILSAMVGIEGEPTIVEDKKVRTILNRILTGEALSDIIFSYSKGEIIPRGAYYVWGR
ncbi:MAG: signal peptide peptidase SppA [Nitrospinota bacterium]|nr:signal peptide peptidase SppA [Nitrospinota bacterium]